MSEKDSGTAPSPYGLPQMSLRDYFAGQALAGMLADPNVRDEPAAHARGAYALADAMLAERAK